MLNHIACHNSTGFFCIKADDFILAIFQVLKINVDFKDLKNGQYKIISFYAKKARGIMARYVIQHKINSVEALKGFTEQGYYYSAEQSKPTHLVFLRDHDEG